MADERVVEFQRSILHNRQQRRPVHQQERDRHAARERMAAGAKRDRLKDWRTPEHHDKLLQRYKPPSHEKLDPLSQNADPSARATPATETKSRFSSPGSEVSRQLYQERRAECQRGMSRSQSSRRVQVHLESPFYSSHASATPGGSSGFSSRIEMLQARKAADHQRAVDTFGSPASMGFADFSCGRKSMEAVIRNINSIADDN